jgi:hypothetical protein
VWRPAALLWLGLHFALLVGVCAAETHRLVARGLTLLPVASRATVGEPQSAGTRTWNLTRRLSTTYRHLAGIERGYGFFAPNVPDAFRLVVEVSSSGSEQPVVGIVSPEGGEAGLRVATFLDSIGRMESALIRRAMLKALAASIFAGQPGATHVSIVIESIRMPTVAGVRDGKQPTFAPVSAEEFSRADVEPDRG